MYWPFTTETEVYRLKFNMCGMRAPTAPLHLSQPSKHVITILVLFAGVVLHEHVAQGGVQDADRSGRQCQERRSRSSKSFP